MTKLFKNSKNALAFVLAFAVLAVSLFTGVAINADAAGVTATYTADEVIFYMDDTADTSFITNGSHEGTETDPYEISTVAQLYGFVSYNNNFTGKYFKVKDGIKVISLQSESNLKTGMGKDDSIAALNAFMGLENGAAVKNYFENVSSKNVWLDNPTQFNGAIDFNGATVVGLYSEHGGLLPKIGPNASIKNIAVKNSYITSNYTSGALVGRAEETATVKTGTIKIENVEVGNCYVESTQAAGNYHAGALIGRVYQHNTNIGAHINKCIVYGNEVRDGNALATSYIIGSMPNVGSTDTTATTYFMMENTISIGCVPYWSNTVSTAAQAGRPPHFNNVYTDKFDDFKPYYTFIGAVDSVASWAGHVDAISADDIRSDEATTKMSGLDWEKDWFMSENGPVLREHHGEIKLTKTNINHYYYCDDCGLKSFGEGNHNWDENYICQDCGWQCSHTEQIDGQFRPGDCVTPDYAYTKCKYCTWEYGDYFGEAPGHTLEWVDEISATCEHDGGHEGRKGYWHCTVCDGNFTSDSEDAAKWAAMDTSITDPNVQLIIPYVPHNANDSESGKILVYSDEVGHYWVCYTCDGKLLAVESKDIAEEGKVKKHKYEDGVCVDCGWECTGHNYKPTGTIVVVGSCTVDCEEEYKCTICGDKQSVVIAPAAHKIVKVDEVKATDKLEGTKAHYACEVCKEIYTDAEGKNKATIASLVIPKVLPAEYQNVVIGGNNAALNTDTSDKSPSTGDSFASVVAFATLAGAALVFTRKVK